MHRGIAARQFVRKFVLNFILADGMEVTDAFMKNGLLHIDLHRPISEPVIKTIPIRV